MSENEALAAPIKQMKRHENAAIPPGSFFSEPVYLEKQFVLAAPEMPFTDKMLATLERWEFKEVYSAGEPTEDYAAK